MRPVLVAVDPGLNRAGVAVFRHSKLICCASPAGLSSDVELPARIRHMVSALVDFVPRLRMIEGVSWIVEWPQIYQRERGKTKGNPNDLLGCAAIAGAIGARGDDVRFVLPAEWKGQTPKPKKKSDDYIIEQRARMRLKNEPTEYNVIPSDLSWDGWDAVALGLWALGRFERRILPGAT